MTSFFRNQTHLAVQPRVPANSTTLPVYRNPLNVKRRCGCPDIAHALDPRAEYSTWRKLWLYLAQSQKQMGVELITDAAIEEMKDHLFITDGDLAEAMKIDKTDIKQMIMTQKFRFSLAVGSDAASQINYAAPFQFVSRNTHVILVRQALDLFIPKLLEVMYRLKEFALSQKSRRGVFRPCYQRTQISTLGRRATDWVLDLGRDLMKLEKIRDDILLCGTQGTVNELLSLSRALGGGVELCEELDALLCKKVGLKGCYDAGNIPTEKYERDLNLAVGSALADLALGISRTLTEWGFFKTKQRDSKSTFMITDLIKRANTDALAIAAEWARCLGHGLAVGPHALQAMFTSVDSLVRRFEYLIVEISPYSIEPLLEEELPAIITSKIRQRMVAGGQSGEYVLQTLAHFSCQTLREQENSGLPHGFFNKIRETVFFMPVWGEIDEMYRSALDTVDYEKTVDAVCAPGGSLDQLFEAYLASVEKVKSYQTPDKGKDKLMESCSSGDDDDDDENPLATAVRWAVRSPGTMVTSDYQSESGESTGRVGNHGYRPFV